MKVKDHFYCSVPRLGDMGLGGTWIPLLPCACLLAGRGEPRGAESRWKAVPCVSMRRKTALWEESGSSQRQSLWGGRRLGERVC